MGVKTLTLNMCSNDDDKDAFENSMEGNQSVSISNLCISQFFGYFCVI